MTIEGQWCDESRQFWRFCPCCGEKHCCNSTPFQNQFKTPSEAVMNGEIATLEQSIKSLKAQADFTLELCKHAISVYKKENERLKVENSRLRKDEIVRALRGELRAKSCEIED